MKKSTAAGQLAKTVQHALQITQGELADRLNIDRSYLSQIVNGHKEPSVRLISHMRNLLPDLRKVKQSLESDSLAGKAAFGEPTLLKEDPAAYGDTMGEVVRYVKQICEKAQKADRATQGWVLHQLRTQLPLSIIEKGQENAVLDEKGETTDPVQPSEPIEGTGLKVTDNPGYKPPVIAQPTRRRPEGPAARPREQSDGEGIASGE